MGFDSTETLTEMMVRLNKNNSDEGVDVEHKMCWKNNRSCPMKRRRMWPTKDASLVKCNAVPVQQTDRWPALLQLPMPSVPIVLFHEVKYSRFINFK